MKKRDIQSASDATLPKINVYYFKRFSKTERPIISHLRYSNRFVCFHSVRCWCCRGPYGRFSIRDVLLRFSPTTIINNICKLLHTILFYMNLEVIGRVAGGRAGGAREREWESEWSVVSAGRVSTVSRSHVYVVVYVCLVLDAARHDRNVVIIIMI